MPLPPQMHSNNNRYAPDREYRNINHNQERRLSPFGGQQIGSRDARSILEAHLRMSSKNS